MPYIHNEGKFGSRGQKGFLVGYDTTLFIWSMK